MLREIIMIVWLKKINTGSVDFSVYEEKKSLHVYKCQILPFIFTKVWTTNQPCTYSWNFWEDFQQLDNINPWANEIYNND